jgi:hypothetical protein
MASFFKTASSFFNNTKKGDQQLSINKVQKQTTTKDSKTPSTTAKHSTTNVTKHNNPKILFPSSELYLKQRQERLTNLAKKQELSNQSSSKISKHAIFIDKEMSSHASVIREFKSECTRLPKQSLVILEKQVNNILPSIHRIECILNNIQPDKTVKQKEQTKRGFLFGRENSRIASPRSGRRDSVKIRGLSEDLLDQFNSDLAADLDDDAV